jgi:hypothetical protein
MDAFTFVLPMSFPAAIGRTAQRARHQVGSHLDAPEREAVQAMITGKAGSR